MNEIISNLSSPAWWLSVVLVAILASLTAAYLKPLLDQEAAKYFDKYRNKTTKLKEERDNEVSLLTQNDHAQVIESLAINRLHLSQIISYLIAIAGLILSSLILNVGMPKWVFLSMSLLSLIYFLFGLIDGITGWKRINILNTALLKRTEEDAKLNESIQPTGD